MDRAFFLTLLLLFYIHISAQNKVDGTVIDKDSRKPVQDVIVQYGSMSKDYDYTKADGRFSIPSGKNDVIFFQCIGYKSRQIPLSSIINNPTVGLELDPVYLEPVLISPKDADKLLDEAMMNTKKKLIFDQSICYLLHFLQTNDRDTIPNEIYMQYATTLKEKDLRKNMKKEKIPYILNIMDIARIQKNIIPLSEMYGAEYHASHLFSFGKSTLNETTRRYTADSSLIVLEIDPIEEKGGWAKGEIIINRKDMAIVSMEIESLESVLEDQPYKSFQGKKVKIIRKAGRFAFKKKNDAYYMSDCYTYYKFRAIDEYGKEEESSYFCDVSFRGFVAKWQLRQRKLSGFCQELYYFPDSTPKEFWNENIIEEDEAIIESHTSDSLRKKELSEREKFINALKKTAIYLPLFGLIYLLD